MLKGVEDRIPNGRWVDLQGHFCGGAVIEIYRNGSGVNETTNEKVTTVSLGDGKFHIAAASDKIMNEHVRSAGVLMGTAAGASGRLSATQSWRLHDVRELERAQAKRTADLLEETRLLKEEADELQRVQDLADAAEAAKLKADAEAAVAAAAAAVAAAAAEAAEIQVLRELEAERVKAEEEVEELAQLLDEQEADRLALMMSPESVASMSESDYGSPSKEYEPIYVGDRVLVNKKRVGVVRYKGPVDFLHGYILYGIELDEPEGKHNGTVGVKTYYRCRGGHGIFAKRPKLQLMDNLDEDSFHQDTQTHQPKYQRPARKAARAAPFSTQTLNLKKGVQESGALSKPLEDYPEAFAKVHGRRQSQSAPLGGSPANGRQSKSPQAAKMAIPSHIREMSVSPSGGTFGASPALYPRGSPAPVRRGVSPQQEHPEETQEEVSQRKLLVSIAKDFGVGSRVLVKKKTISRMGKVMFIGRSHLGKGTYIGVELVKDADTQHFGPMDLTNGTVDGREYFKCPHGRGVLVKASAVYWYSRKVSDLYPQ
jgi:hypothetical protein